MMIKKLIFALILSVGLVACEGDRGPQGPPGPPGVNIVGITFEYSGIYFDYIPQNNLFSTIVDVPAGVQVLESDAILVYRLIVFYSNGQPINTWSLIPQNYFLDRGTIQYVYNHTQNDVQLLITGNFDLSTLSRDFTDNQTFRFVVIPSDYAMSHRQTIQTLNDLREGLQQAGGILKSVQ